MQYLEFQVGIHDSDGLRILRCWKFLTPFFRCANCKNDAIEVVNLQWQCASLSLETSHAASVVKIYLTHGRPGGDIPSMEHINRAFKTVLRSLGSNLTEKSLDRVGRCNGPVGQC